jgi:hypothetical protein
VRRALKPFGIEGDKIEISADAKPFRVQYDPSKTSPEKLLAALKKERDTELLD